MAGAVREVSVHRGFDPRDFVLVAFGGAGPMHGFLVADELAMARVLIPRFPGHLSALGQMLADHRCDFVRAWGGKLSVVSHGVLSARADEMAAEAARQLVDDGIDEVRHQHSFSVDMRYVGQSFTLPIAWDRDDRDLASLRHAFDARHEETFGYAAADNDAEIVNIRLVSVGLVDKPDLDFVPVIDAQPRNGLRRVWFGGWCEAAIYDRALMPVGYQFEGPAIVEEAGGTSVVPPGWRVRVHHSGALECLRSTD